MSTHKLALIKKYPARTIKFENGKMTESSLDEEMELLD